MIIKIFTDGLDGAFATAACSRNIDNDRFFIFRNLMAGKGNIAFLII